MNAKMSTVSYAEFREVIESLDLAITTERNSVTGKIELWFDTPDHEQAVANLRLTDDQALGLATALLMSRSPDTSALHGYAHMVEITYNTTPEGVWADEDDHSNRTLHGPFGTLEEAQAWMDAYPDDTDVRDMETIVVNLVSE